MAKKKYSFRNDIMRLSIFTTIVVVIWIGLEVYFRLTEPTTTEVPLKVLRPLDPSFEEEVLSEIEGRRFIKEEELKGIHEKQLEESEEATASAESEEATPSAEPEGE